MTGCVCKGVLRALLLLPLLAAPVLAEAELRDTDKRTWKRVKKLLPHYLWEPKARKRAQYETKWEEAGYAALRLDRKQFAELGKILRNGSPYTTEKRREKTIEVRYGAELIPVRVAITTKYKPGCGRSFPLILSLHGGPAGSRPAASAGAATQYTLWKRYAQTATGIVACPAIPGANIGNREWGILAAVITAIDRIYNVDRDRVLLTGHSWGGIVTWRLGPLYADRFAGLAPFVCAVNPGESHLRNLKNVPVYSVQGKRDMKWMLDTGRARIEILKKLQYEHVYRELSGGHEAFPVEIPKIVEWFGQRPRNLYAPEIVRTRPSRTRAAPPQWYWLRTESPAFRARIDGNTIDVDCDGAFEVLLADEMVDLDKPVKIVRDEETLFEGKVERSLGFALEHVRKTTDRARVFASSVKID